MHLSLSPQPVSLAHSPIQLSRAHLGEASHFENLCSEATQDTRGIGGETISQLIN